MPLWLVGFYFGLAKETIGGADASAATPDDGDDDGYAYDYARDDGRDGRRLMSHQGEHREHHTPVQTGDGGFPVLVLALMISGCVSVGVHFTCTDRKPPPTFVAAPLALIGFACAATWIDTIANNLVSVLGFFGWLLGIPQPVLGLTVLAWGNSIGDYSTNMAMARKG
jgi:Ca2+/Na+ antiporter